MDIQYPEKGILTHANHFNAARFRSADLAWMFIPDAYIRSQRLRRLMEEHHGALSVAVMQRLLQDHNNYPGAVCRHRDPGAPIELSRLMKTLISIITCPAGRKAYICAGNPCENDYAEYSL